MGLLRSLGMRCTRVIIFGLLLGTSCVPLAGIDGLEFIDPSGDGGGGTGGEGEGGAPGGLGGLGGVGGAGGGSAGAGGAALQDEYEKLILEHSPVAYYRLDDDVPSDTILDSSGHDRHATVMTGTALPESFPGGMMGNTAIRFSGGTFAVVSASELTFSAEEPFTIEAWVRFFAPSDYFGAIVDCTTGLNGYQLNLDYNENEAGTVAFYRRNSTDLQAVAATQALTNGATLFHHVVATYGAGFARVYIDGSLADGSNIPVVSIGAHGGVFRFGAEAMFGEAEVTLDEVAIYDRELTITEILLHQACGEIQLCE